MKYNKIYIDLKHSKNKENIKLYKDIFHHFWSYLLD